MTRVSDARLARVMAPGTVAERYGARPLSESAQAGAGSTPARSATLDRDWYHYEIAADGRITALRLHWSDLRTWRALWTVFLDLAWPGPGYPLTPRSLPA